MDLLIVEPACDEKQAPRCHLLSVFGGEQEIAAIHAAIADQANFRIAGPDLSPMVISLGERAHTFRGLIQAPGRRQPVRYLVSVSQEVFETQAGANAQAKRTVVYSADSEFLVYRLGVRFGIPLLPCWSNWIRADLHGRIAFAHCCSRLQSRARRGLKTGITRSHCRRSEAGRSVDSR
jgi:hypothetical protein